MHRPGHGRGRGSVPVTARARGQRRGHWRRACPPIGMRVAGKKKARRRTQCLQSERYISSVSTSADLGMPRTHEELRMQPLAPR
eukprot:7494776-Pyramimonas_sp.AAC.1